MNLFRSIKFQVWLKFELVAAAMLALIYTFLVLLFPMFYQWMKVYEVSDSLSAIQSGWNKSNVQEVIEDVALDNKLYVEIHLADTWLPPFRFNKMGGGLSIANISKSGFITEINASDTGIIYREFVDEQEDNTVMMVGSYLGEREEPCVYMLLYPAARFHHDDTAQAVPVCCTGGGYDNYTDIGTVCGEDISANNPHE